MHSKRSTLLLTLMMVLAPALGSPTEELLQDTLKSILVAFFTLSAAIVFFWDSRKGQDKLQCHWVLMLPIALMFYAMGSMAWSHTYLAGAEAIRWFLFGVILLLGLNGFTNERVTVLAWGIHIGAVIASLWTALQFWVDFSFFSQGPNPASTFVNRNFFGEFIVCTVPFSLLLMMRVKDKTTVVMLSFSLAFNVVALMMTGTRSALIAMTLLALMAPSIAVLYRGQVSSSGWRLPHVALLGSVFFASVIALGSLETLNVQLIKEKGAQNALMNSIARGQSLTESSEYSEGTFAVRAVMWRATMRMIEANPFAGVGAGAWEVQLPLYQSAGARVETDYYAHNEILQLIAEYGILGWLFFFSLSCYLLRSAYLTLIVRTPEAQSEAPMRALILASLLMLLIVSNAGFPWRMASTGAIFALNLSILAASDIRLGNSNKTGTRVFQLLPGAAWIGMVLAIACATLAIYISQKAIECESKLVRAIRIGITISQSGKPQDPHWDKAKSEMLALIRDGISINPHYRKITPIAADTIAGWGDWKNATWIWESVLQSRPYVVALMENICRGRIVAGEYMAAGEMLQRAHKLQPTSPTLDILQVLLWGRTGHENEAAPMAKKLIRDGASDPDFIRISYFMGMHIRDPELAILALEARIRLWPNQAIDGWLKLGQIYDAPEAKNEEKALSSFKAALSAADPQYRVNVLAAIPPKYRAKLE